MIQHAKVLSNKDRWKLTKFDHLPGIVILEFKNNKEVINFINSNDNLVYWNSKYLRILKIEKIFGINIIVINIINKEIIIFLIIIYFINILNL